jgi:nitrogen regulatory protein PII-like uncharacterized protein
MKLFDFNAFTLNEKLLLEGRIETLEEKYKDKIPDEAIKWLKDNDPTLNNAYFEWSLKTYANLDVVEKENLDRWKVPYYKTFTKILTKFHNNRNKLSTDERDINNYRRITPKIFDIAEEFGHNDRGGKNWCVCYDYNHFCHYFCPDGGITMIINKLNSKKDLALQKTKDGDVTVWDYQDDSVFHFVYRTQSKNFIHYLQQQGDYEFVIDYFKENPLRQSDMPKIDIDDLKQYWIDSVSYEWWYLCDYWDVVNFVDYDDFKKIFYDNLVSDINNQYNHISKEDILSYIKETDLDKNLSPYEYHKLHLESDFESLIKFIDDYGDIESFFDYWFNENVDEEYLKNLLKEYAWQDLEDIIDVKQMLKNKADEIDEDELIENFYGNDYR